MVSHYNWKMLLLRQILSSGHYHARTGPGGYSELLSM